VESEGAEDEAVLNTVHRKKIQLIQMGPVPTGSLNDLWKTRLFCGRMILLHTHPFPPSHLLATFVAFKSFIISPVNKIKKFTVPYCFNLKEK
jgi:hypothetical protein